MKQLGFVFELGELVRDPEGTKVKFEIDEKVPFELDDVKALSNVECEISFMKVEDGILTEIKDLTVDLEFECTKCRQKYKLKIDVPEANRVYYFEKQKDVQDIMDIFYFDLKNMQIDVSDFIRQEIILHFPMIPVCSNSCKGLCPVCGINLNKKSCNCKKGSKQEKPLAILKQLYNAKTSGTEEKDS
jgi:uncharacterized protein